MSLALVLPFLATISGTTTQARVVSAQVPDQPVEFQVALAGFEAEPANADNPRVILRGTFGADLVVSVMCDENLPFLVGADCRKRYEASKGYEAFQAGGVAGCKFSDDLEGSVSTQHYYGWLSTPDHRFTLHLSKTSSANGPSKAEAFADSEFTAVLNSMRAEGKADRAKFIFPPEVYAFRDQAAPNAPNQFEWVAAKAQENPNDFAVQFYLGAVAYQLDKTEQAGTAFGRAAEIGLRNDERDGKQTHALFVALDRQASTFARKARYQEALETCRRLAGLAEKSDHPQAPAFRQNALFNVAVCEAHTQQEAAAIETLRKLIALDPSAKKRVADHALLRSLHGLKEFQALVGS